MTIEELEHLILITLEIGGPCYRYDLKFPDCRQQDIIAACERLVWRRKIRMTWDGNLINKLELL